MEVFHSRRTDHYRIEEAICESGDRAPGHLDLLLAAGAHIDYQDALGQSVAMHAAVLMAYPMVLHLLEAGASPNLADHRGERLAEIVAERIPAAARLERARQEVLRFLSATRDTARWSPAMHAV